MISRSIFDDEHEIFRESVRRFLESEAVPYHDQWERDGCVDRQIWNKAGNLGFLVPTAAEELGGVGGDFRYNVVLGEEIARAGLSGLGFSLHNDVAVPYLLRLGSAAQKEKYIGRCITGEIITAIAMTEPGTGSDLQGIKTTAVRVDNEYVINGSKTFITNGILSDLVIVVCKTDTNAGAQGFSLLLVESGTPGFKKGNKLEKIGMKAQDTAELFFHEVRVPADNVLGEVGKGFFYLMQELPQERLSVAVNAISSAESILAKTVSYVKQRDAFGKTIADFQNTQFSLAEIDAELERMRVYVDKCIELHVTGALDAVTASKAKLMATDLQFDAINRCLQLYGGYGYMWEYQVARAFADSRVQSIYGGTNEVMKLIIARELFKD